MAKNRKKKGPPPVCRAGHTDYRDRWRRVIRVLMVAVGVLLLLVALAIPVANNAVALGLEKEMKALPLPPNTTLIETSSVAGKLQGSGNGMQYYGALLVQSSADAAALQAYYNDGLENALFGGYHVIAARDMAADSVAAALPLRTQERGEGYYVIYHAGAGDSPLQAWLDLDLRGH